MFADLSAEVESRLLMVQQSLSAVARIESEATFSPDVTRCLKGLTFVQLYAVYEHAVTGAVQEAIRIVNSTGLTLSELRYELLSMLLDDSCRSLEECGPARTWDARLTLMRRSRSAERVNAPESLFPRDGSHYRIEQLRTIWAVFGINSPQVPDNRHIGRIAEIVENRNAITHGRVRAEEVGSRFSMGDLSTRHSDTADICRYVIRTLEDHVTDTPRLRA